MDILIFAIVLLVIVALAIYAVDLIPADGRLRIAIKLLIIVAAIIALCSKAGLI